MTSPDNAEQWRPVSEFPEAYVVSSLGRIRAKGPVPRLVSQRLDARTGRLRVSLSFLDSYTDTVKTVQRFVDLLVAETFLPGAKRGELLHYRDGDKRNVAASNLYWAAKQRSYKPAELTKLTSSPATAPAQPQGQTLAAKFIAAFEEDNDDPDLPLKPDGTRYKEDELYDPDWRSKI